MPPAIKLSTQDGPVHLEEFDAEWYLARYPDIAAAGIDPLHHYQEHGRKEKRSPNAEREPRNLWATRFDQDWYATHYVDVPTSGLEPLEHFIRYGILDRRFPNRVEAGRAQYAASFDADWYLKRNPEVAESHVDPLSHYVSQGILEDRRPNSNIALKSTPVLDARIECLKEPTEFENIGLFVAHSPDGTLKPHVEPYLKALRDNGITIILIIAADKDLSPLSDSIVGLLNGVYIRENVGFDFSAWAHVIHLNKEIWDAEILYFLNDSILGPTNKTDFEQMITKVISSPADVIGLTENFDRGWHLQSYFLAFKRKALKSKSMRTFVGDIVSYTRKNDVVNECETQMASVLRRAGLNCIALFSRPGASNPTLYHWEEMLEGGYPFVKISTLRGDTEAVDSSHWRNTLSTYGYDTSVADRTLAEFWRSIMPFGHALSDIEQRVRLKSLAELHDFFADQSFLNFGRAEYPELSIVLINRNNAQAAYQIINALSIVTDLSAECIVIDDASTDSSTVLFEKIHGISVIRNSEPIGFIRSANRGASKCRGRFSLFLSTDALVTTDSLRNALEMLRGGEIGVVSAKISRLDRRLANAGSILWRDGSSTAFGSDQDIDGAEFAFQRDVDASSLPFVLVDFDLFESLGRFDPTFNFAQSSVFDLCLKMRSAGRRIVYAPQVNVLSLRTVRASFADSNNEQADRQRIASLHRWHLAKHQLPAAAGALWGRQADRTTPRLLLLGERLPRAGMAGLSPRVTAIAEASQKAGYAVTFFPARHSGTNRGLLETELDNKVELLIRADPISLWEVLEERKAFYQVIYVLGRENMIELAKHVDANSELYHGVQIVYDSSLLASSPLPVGQRSEAAIYNTGTILRTDIELAALADVFIVDCEESMRFLEDSGCPNVRLLPPVLRATLDTPGFAERKDILVPACLDRDDSPDLQALFDFVETTLPHLDRLIGCLFTINVVGPTGAPRLGTFRHSRVVIHGPIGDLSACIDRSRIMIHLPSNSDPRIFSVVCEGAARGLPSVLSEHLTEQFSGRLRSAMSSGDTPEVFAEACGKLYTDEECWTRAHGQLVEAVQVEASIEHFEAHALPIIQALQPLGLRNVAPSPRTSVRPIVKGGDFNQVTPNSSVALSSTSKNKLSGDIALVYLARGADKDAMASFERFLTSYRKYAAGADHDFFVILKGFESSDTRETAEAIFVKAGARVIHLPDEGFDLGAYVAAARQIRNEQLCFLNTNAEILCDDWLYWMALRLRRSEVGMVGATGSFEAMENFEGNLRFPNVHLRSNAFLISRRLFRSIMDSRIFHTKEDAYAAESGPASLTRQVLGRGFDVLIVGSNGRAYPPAWWPSSDTFRQGKQENLIVGDNQTRLFDEADNATKEWLLRRAWGELIDTRDLNE